MKENVQLIFFYVKGFVAASGNISIFFDERAAASKKILTTAPENYQKKMCSYFLQLCPLKKYFEVIKLNIMMETSSRKLITFMYFWLNYVDKGNAERIPIGVKNIDHLSRMAPEAIEADTLHLFKLSDGTRTDDNKY